MDIFKKLKRKNCKHIYVPYQLSRTCTNMLPYTSLEMKILIYTRAHKELCCYWVVGVYLSRKSI